MQCSGIALSAAWRNLESKDDYWLNLILCLIKFLNWLQLPKQQKEMQNTCNQLNHWQCQLIALTITSRGCATAVERTTIWQIVVSKWQSAISVGKRDIYFVFAETKLHLRKSPTHNVSQIHAPQLMF